MASPAVEYRRSISAVLRRRWWPGRTAAAGALSLAVVLLFVATGVLAPIISPYSPEAMDFEAVLAPPSLTHPFGTDELGRDVFSRTVYGARVSLQVGLISVGIALTIGTALGTVAGYYGGVIDLILSQIINVMLAFPELLLALAVLAVLGPSLQNAMIAVGVSAIPVYGRTARGATLEVLARDYVQAAKAVGASDLRVIVRHVLPNIAAPVIVLATVGVGTAILAAAGLSYVGLGAQPPTPEWGAMLAAARTYMRDAWWLVVFPGSAIMVVVIALNILGDHLRDILDPRRRGSFGQ